MRVRVRVGVCPDSGRVCAYFLFYDGQVQNVRLQTQTAEEKAAWIRALRDAISRAKNKIFDEVSFSISVSRCIPSKDYHGTS